MDKFEDVTSQRKSAVWKHFMYNIISKSELSLNFWVQIENTHNWWLFYQIQESVDEVVAKLLGCCISSRRYMKLFILQILFDVWRSVIY